MIKESIFDWWSLIIMLGIIQGIIIMVVLFYRGRKNTAALLLGFLVLVLIWHHLQSISIYLGLFKIFPHFYGADLGSLFLIGPLFLFYIRYQTYEKTGPFKWSDWLHFLPFIGTLIIHPVIFQGTEAKVKTIEAWLTATRYDNPVLKKSFLLDRFYFSIRISSYDHLLHTFSILSKKLLQGPKKSGFKHSSNKLSLAHLCDYSYTNNH